MQDVRLALRSLRATPIVATVAVLSLALGIGANVALFSLVNGLLLRPLPVESPSELVMVSDTGTPATVYWVFPVWEELQRRPGLFEGMCAWSPAAATYIERNHRRPIAGAWVSGSYFRVLGVGAAVGRVLTDEDDRPGGGANGPVMVISDAFWQRRFQRDPAAVGSRLDLNGVLVSIVGVAAPGFLGTDVGTAFDAWLPLADESTLNGAGNLTQSGNIGVVLLARSRPGQTSETATSALRAIQTDLRDSVRGRTPSRFASDPDYLKDPFIVVSAALGTSRLRGRFGSALIALTGAASLVLLVACANIANVLLARASARRRELTVRLALGASRWRLIRQLLVESGVLAVLASTAGVLMATWASALVVQQLSTQNVPISLDFAVDWRLVTFSSLVATMAILVFGVTPAIRATAVSPIDALKEQGRGGATTSGWMPGALVVVQIALSLVLLVGAGLFVRTFVSLASRDPGFTRDRVLLAPIDGQRVSDPLQRVRAYERVRQEVRTVPSVATVSLSFVTPAQNFGFTPPIEVSKGRRLPERERFVFTNLISTDWFRTFDVPIVMGRDFAEGDRVGAEHVAIVNQAFSRKFLDGKEPLGQFITLPDFMVEPSPNIPIRIVGVAADAVYASLRERPEPTMYLPLAQHEEPPFLRLLGNINLVIRADGGASARLEERARTAIENVDPRLIVTFRPFAEQLNDSLARERVMATLAGFFGVLAMLLAGLGLYGVTAYAVARRRGEIGIRMALGATPASVVHMVVLRVAFLVGSGALVGVGISAWLGRSIASLLYGIQPHDSLTLASSVLTLAVVGTLAAWLPAWRASRLDPAEVLRET